MAKVIPIPIGPIFSGGSCRGLVHVIQKGDTLYGLGKQYHVSVTQLMFANPFVDVYNLQIGDELCIPATIQPRQAQAPSQWAGDPTEEMEGGTASRAWTGTPSGRIGEGAPFGEQTGMPSGRMDGGTPTGERTGMPSGRIEEGTSTGAWTGMPSGGMEEGTPTGERTGTPSGRVDDGILSGRGDGMLPSERVGVKMPLDRNVEGEMLE